MRIFHPVSLTVLFSLVVACGSPDGSTPPIPRSIVHAPPRVPANASVLAHDRHVSGEIAAAGGRVYWVDRGPDIADSIQSAPASGGDAKVLYAVGYEAAIEDLAVDETSVYWVEVTPVNSGLSSKLLQIPETGGSPRVLASSAEPLLIVAVDGGFVYFGDLLNSLERVPVGGGRAATVATAVNGEIAVSAVAANAWGACWAAPDGRAAMKVVCEASGSGAPTAVASRQGGVTNIAMNEHDVVWVTSDDPTSPAHTKVHVAPLSGGTVTDLANATNVAALAADETYAYFLEKTDTAGSLQRVPLGGGPATALTEGLSLGLPSLTSAVQLAMDASSVFWTDPHQGLVLAVPK